MRPPQLADDAFLAEIASHRERSRHTPDELQVWWTGQSGFLVQWNGHAVLLDPYLSDSLTRKYATTDKPHVRMTGRVVDPARLTGISVVTSSHLHTDHLDPETLHPLAAANPGLIMVCPEATRATVTQRCGLPPGRIVGMDARPPLDRTKAGPAVFHAIPAAHERLDTDTEGRLVYLGFVVELGPFRIYHSGDTVLYDGMEALLRSHEVDLALLPINGRAPERRVSGNLWGREAARLAHDIRARMVVPCHYDMFEFNTATPDEFVATCRDLGQAHEVLGQGGRLTLSARPARA